jgi:hypothetical protein
MVLSKLVLILLLGCESLSILRILVSIVSMILILWVTRLFGRHTHLQLILGLVDIIWILWHHLLHLTWHFRLHLSFGENKILVRLELLLISILHRISPVLLLLASWMPNVLRHAHGMVRTMLILHHVMLIILVWVTLKVHIYYDWNINNAIITIFWPVYHIYI